jgi:chromosome segregation ATPase
VSTTRYLKILRTGAKMAAMLGRELADVYAIPAGQALTRYGIQQTEVRAQNAAAHLEHVQAALPEATAELGRLVVQTAQARNELAQLQAENASLLRVQMMRRESAVELAQLISKRRAELESLGMNVELVDDPAGETPDGCSVPDGAPTPVASSRG